MNNLPNEILLKIIQQCASKKTALVCRKWYELSLPILYSCFKTYDRRRLYRLLRTILERPELGKLLRSINLSYFIDLYDASSSDVGFHELFQKTQGRIYNDLHDLFELLVHYTSNLQSITIEDIHSDDLLSLMLLPAIQTVVVMHDLDGSKRIPEKYFGVSSLKKLEITMCNVPAEEFSDILKVPRELRELEFFIPMIGGVIEAREYRLETTTLKDSLEKLCIGNGSFGWDMIVGPPKDFKKLRKLKCWDGVMGASKLRTWALPESLEELVIWVSDIGQVERILELARDKRMRSLKRVELLYYSDELPENICISHKSCRDGVDLVYTPRRSLYSIARR
jgi:F-box-like